MNLTVSKVGLNNRAMTFGMWITEDGPRDKKVQDFIDVYDTPIAVDKKNKQVVNRALKEYQSNSDFYHAIALTEDFTNTGTISDHTIEFWMTPRDVKVKVGKDAAKARNAFEFLNSVQVVSKSGKEEFERIKEATRKIHEDPLYKQIHKLSTELSETNTLRQTTLQRTFSNLRPNINSTIAMVSQFEAKNPIDAENKKILADSMKRLTENDFFINASDIVEEFKRTSKVKEKSIGLAIGDTYSGYNRLHIDEYARSVSDYANDFYLYDTRAEKPLSKLKNVIVRMERNKHLIEASKLLKKYDKNGEINDKDIKVALKNLRVNKFAKTLKSLFR